MECPHCGARNTDQASYCASCAAPLREPEGSRPAQHQGPEVAPPRDFTFMVDGSFLTALIVITIIWTVIHIAAYALDREPLRLVMAAVAVPLVAFYYIWKRRSKRSGMAAPMFPNMSHGPPPQTEGTVASAKSVTLAGLAAVAVISPCLGGTFLAVGLLANPGALNVGTVIATLMGVSLLVLPPAMVVMGRADMTVSRDGARVYSPLTNMTIRFDREDIAALRVKGAILRMDLKKAPFGMSRRVRYVVLGGAAKRGEFRQAVLSLGYEGTP